MTVRWDELVYQCVVGPEKGNVGAVCGSDGGVWGRSETMNISLEEVRNCWKVFYHPTTIETFTLCGVVFRIKEISENLEIDYITAVSEKYQCGCTLIQTNNGFVIGYYDSPITSEQNVKATLKLAENVFALGY